VAAFNVLGGTKSELKTFRTFRADEPTRSFTSLSRKASTRGVKVANKFGETGSGNMLDGVETLIPATQCGQTVVEIESSVQLRRQSDT